MDILTGIMGLHAEIVLERLSVSCASCQNSSEPPTRLLRKATLNMASFSGIMEYSGVRGSFAMASFASNNFAI